MVVTAVYQSAYYCLLLLDGCGLFMISTWFVAAIGGFLISCLFSSFWCFSHCALRSGDEAITMLIVAFYITWFGFAVIDASFPFFRLFSGTLLMLAISGLLILVFVQRAWLILCL